MRVTPRILSAVAIMIAAALVGCAEPVTIATEPPAPTVPTLIVGMPTPTPITLNPTATATEPDVSVGGSVDAGTDVTGLPLGNPDQPTPIAVDGGDQRAITQADNGQTVTFQEGEMFLLKLSKDADNMYWEITIKDPDVIVQAYTFVAIKDAQGLFSASKRGQTTLSATGKPVCKPDEACPLYIIEFQVNIVVK